MSGEEEPEELEDFNFRHSFLRCVHDLQSLFGEDWEVNLCTQLDEYTGRPPGSFVVCCGYKGIHIQIGRRSADIPFQMETEDIFTVAGNLTTPDRSRADHFAVGSAERKHNRAHGDHQCRLR